MTDLRYVYAVCRPWDAPLQAELTGVWGAPVKPLRHGPLVAVVSAVPERDFAEEPLRAHLEDLDWLAATARAHEAVIAALTTVTSPLPMRLATVFRDNSGVRAMLEAESEHLEQALDRLAGRVEWGVKVHLDPVAAGASAGPSATDTTNGSAAASGRDYLRQRRRERSAQEASHERATEFVRKLHARLSGHAEDSRLHPPQTSVLSDTPGRNVLNAAYLVKRSASEEFVELVDHEEEDAGAELHIELTGPWAPYSFTQSDDGPEE